MSQWDKALISFDKSIIFGEDSEIAANSKFCKFKTYEKQGKFTEAEKQLKKSLKHYGNLENSYNKNFALYLTGKFYSQNYFPDIGIDYLLQAYKGFDELNHSSKKIMVGREISTLYAKMKNYPMSIAYMEKCEEEALTTEDNEKELSSIYNRKAALFTFDGKPDSALVYLKKCKKIYEQTNDTIHPSRYIYNLASAYQLKQLYQKAIDTYRLDLEQKIKEERYNEYSILYNEMANYALMDNQLPMANSYLDSSKKFLYLENSKIIWLRYYDIRSRFYSAQNDFEKALEYKTIYTEEYEKKFKKETAERHELISQQYEAKEKEEKIILMKLADANQKTIIAEKETEIATWIFVAFAFLLILISLLILYQYKKQKHHSEKTTLQLSRLQDIFNGQEEVKQEISRNLHDLVSAHLQGIRIKISCLPLSKEQENLAAETAQNLEDVNEQIRLISHRLSPLRSKRKKHKLGKIISAQLAQFQLYQGIFVELESQLPPELDQLKQLSEEHLYAVITETLANAGKYSEATLLTVKMEVKEEKFCLRMTDNGVGSKKGTSINGIGLINMRHRADLLHGTFEFEATENGTRTSLIFPIKQNLRQLL